MKEELLLIDANSLIYRAYHALPPLTGPEGKPTGALYGLASILIKLLQGETPRYIVAAFDRPEPTFRKEKFKEYKATRPPTPDDLIPQLEEAKNMLKMFGIKTVEAPGFEADDIIATLARRFETRVEKIIILSGDLDTLQLVRGDRVVAEIPKRGISETITYNDEAVFDRLGVKPEHVTDYKGLVGDTSDNIPGVPGVGPKTASSLISKHGSLEDIYKNIEKVRVDSPTLAQKLQENKERALFSKELATTSEEAPSPDDISELEAKTSLEDEKLHDYLKSKGFKTLLKRVLGIGDEGDKKTSKIGKLF